MIDSKTNIRILTPLAFRNYSDIDRFKRFTQTLVQSILLSDKWPQFRKKVAIISSSNFIDLLFEKTKQNLLADPKLQPKYSRTMLLKAIFQNMQSLNNFTYSYDYIQMRPLYALSQTIIYTILSYQPTHQR